MRTPEQIKCIVDTLTGAYPEADCTLDFDKPYELLFSVRLAAQCTDERVNKVTPALFERFPTLESFAQADVAEVEDLVRSCGFYHSKAKDIVACAKELLERFDGRVPDNMDDLVSLPGVGRKTANLILGDIYNVPRSTVVDTHCIRISNRLGLVDGTKDPVKIEMQLRSVLPPDKSSSFCHCIVYHGRAVCDARRPDCGNCVLSKWCAYFEEINRFETT